ncbi:TAXADIENE 5-ALPHA HYDROXYLASE [Salix viminalis]|uniref:TAXADIENE 5-ALPHA HYDROXYLASE n=1 Tax=Salix viminalis TaxID=40686 RepID=A0A9Q0UID4_SALVM|nr:TAXADIENE 5-ALPHA HYDROXYLASE [Salix viminalis]
MLIKVVREKRKEMESGLVGDERMLFTRFVSGMIRGEISEEEVIDNVVLLVFAAHDTTSFAIAMTFKMLAEHPDCHSLLLQEHDDIMSRRRPGENLTLEDTKKMKYTWQVARESMRLFPPIFGSFRKAIADIEYEGFTIPKGWKILWTTYGTHYNEEYFKDPLTFNPRRFEEPIPPYAYLPFGGGPRICAGNQLAKLNILIFIHYVVTRYNWSLLCPDEQITMDPSPIPFPWNAHQSFSQVILEDNNLRDLSRIIPSKLGFTFYICCPIQYSIFHSIMRLILCWISHLQ